MYTEQIILFQTQGVRRRLRFGSPMKLCGIRKTKWRSCFNVTAQPYSGI